MELETYQHTGRIFCMMEYKVKIFIRKILREKLELDKRLLISQQKDKECPEQIYQKTLDRCTELNYALKQMEKEL